MDLTVQMLDEELPAPQRAYEGDAGLDLHARHPAVLEPGATVVLPTGVAVAIPEDHAGLVLPRSGLAARHGVTLVNAPGLIDSGYRGEIRVILINHGARRVQISRADRIAQLVIVPISTPDVVTVDALEDSERGSGGLGSSGA